MTKPFDPTKPVQTRDGRAARIICTDLKGTPGASIVALITEKQGHEVTYTVSDNGTFWWNRDAPGSVNDLVNIPTKRSGWINIYSDRKVGSVIYAIKEQAVCDAIGAPCATIQIEWEE